MKPDVRDTVVKKLSKLLLVPLWPIKVVARLFVWLLKLLISWLVLNGWPK